MVHTTFLFGYWSLKSDLLFAVSGKTELGESCRTKEVEATQFSLVEAVAGVWKLCRGTVAEVYVQLDRAILSHQVSAPV
jgi:hypothetical protein